MAALAVTALASLLHPAAVAAQGAPCEARAGWLPDLPVLGRPLSRPTSLTVCRRHEPIVVVRLEAGDRLIQDAAPSSSRRLLVVSESRTRVRRFIEVRPDEVREVCRTNADVGASPEVVSHGGTTALTWRSGSDSAEALVCSPSGLVHQLSAPRILASPDGAYLAGYTPLDAPRASGDELWIFDLDRASEVARRELRCRGLRWLPGRTIVLTADGEQAVPLTP